MGYLNSYYGASLNLNLSKNSGLSDSFHLYLSHLLAVPVLSNVSVLCEILLSFSEHIKGK